MAQQAGTFDRFWNSTFGLPQQLLWRVVRALEDDRVDLFSAQGLLDPALLPGIGIFADHKNDVMPDYMAETMGFGDSAVGQFGASILSDPLTFLTGGATSLAKVGKNSAKLLRGDVAGSALRAAAAKSGKNLDDWMASTSAEDFLKAAEGGLEEARRLNDAKRVKKVTKYIEAARKELPQAASRLAQVGDETGVPFLSAQSALKNTVDRQIAIAVPGLYTLGVRRHVLPEYSSWFQVFGDYSGASKATAILTNRAAQIPYVNKAVQGAAKTAASARLGWKAGGQVSYAVRNAARQMEPEERALMTHWLSEKGGRDVVPQLQKLGDEGVEEVVEAYVAGVKANLPHEEAFARALRSNRIGSSKETGAQLWARFTGSPLEDAVFPSWGKGHSRGAAKIRQVFAASVENHAKASTLRQTESFQAQIAESLGQQYRNLFELDQAELSPRLAALAEFSFDTGKKFKELVNLTFKTGTKFSVGEKAIDKLLAATARDNDQVEALAGSLITSIAKIAKDPSNPFTYEDLSYVATKLIEIDGLPGEMQATFRAIADIRDPRRAIKAVNNLNERQRRGLNLIEKMISAESPLTPGARDTLADAFEDDFFTYFERMGNPDDPDAATFFRTIFTRPLTPTVTETVTYSPRELERFRSKTVGHVLLGDSVEEGRNSLGEFAGKRAGTLSDEELDRALELTERRGMRSLSREEQLEAVADLPQVQKAAKKYGIDVEEALDLFRRRGATATRVVTREGPPAPVLWDAARTRWSVDDAQKTLDAFGFGIQRTDVADSWMRRLLPAEQRRELVPRLHISSRKLKPSTLAKTYGIKLKPSYQSIGEAMADLRAQLEASPRYLEKYGPTPKATRLEVARADSDFVKALYDQLPLGQKKIILGSAEVFDETLLSASGAADYRRLSDLKARRALPKGHRLRDSGQIVGTKVTQRSVEAPRFGDELELWLERNGTRLSESELPRVSAAYGRARALNRELRSLYVRSAKQGVEFDPPPELLAELQQSLEEVGSLVSSRVLASLPESMRKVFSVTRELQRYQFDEAVRAGVWIPGSPIAYMPRYFSPEGRARMAKILGDIDAEDGSLLTRLGVKQAQRFGRNRDDISLEELDAITEEIRQLSVSESASPAFKQLHARIEGELAQEGISFRAIPGVTVPYRKAGYEQDPFLALMQRLGAASQDRNLENFFDTMVATKDANGNALMLGGRVVGVLDDTGATRRLEEASTRYRTRFTNKDASELVSVAEASNEEFVPKAFLIEDANGQVHTVGNEMLNGYGFGLLKLGNGAPEFGESLGYVPTVGKSFARASMRSDLISSLQTQMLEGLRNTEELLGQHVVFGQQDIIQSAVKSAMRIHKVTPAALRNVDSANYMIKSFQTIYRPAFHLANLSSGVFQAHLAGASSKNILLAYNDTLRLLFGSEDFAKQAEFFGDLVEDSAEVVSRGKQSLFGGNRRRLLDVVRQYGDGSLAKHFDDLLEDGLENVESLVLKGADGQEVDVSEFVSLAAEMGLYGTFASSLARGSRTVSESLLRVKLLALGSEAKGLAGASARAQEKVRRIAESSEVINRTMTALALAREGHPMRRAIEMAKDAHVPYEKLTPAEQWAKRAMVYYTFPRHYMPWAWKKFGEDPQALAPLAAFFRDQSITTEQQGKPTIAVGPYRIDAGRLNANLEAASFVAAFGDVILDTTEALVPGVSTVDARDLSQDFTFGGLTNLGGLASMAATMGGSYMQGGNLLEEAMQMTFATRALSRLMGKTPGISEKTPEVQYSVAEDFLRSMTGVRKVRPAHEERIAINNYRREIQKLRLRAAATEDEGKRQRLMGHAQTLNESLQQILSEYEQRAVK